MPSGRTSGPNPPDWGNDSVFFLDPAARLHFPHCHPRVVHRRRVVGSRSHFHSIRDRVQHHELASAPSPPVVGAFTTSQRRSHRLTASSLLLVRSRAPGDRARPLEAKGAHEVRPPVTVVIAENPDTPDAAAVWVHEPSGVGLSLGAKGDGKASWRGKRG